MGLNLLIFFTKVVDGILELPMKLHYISRFLKTQKQQRIAVVLCGIFLIGLGFLFYAYFASAATRTWTGAVDNNWSNAGNWSGGKPGSGDIAKFDNTCIRCDVTIDESPNVLGINFDATYTGTTTQSGSVTITVGASGWAQAGGVFQGGSGNITTQIFSLTGGTFYSTSGTLTINYATAGSSIDIFTFSGGVFSAGTGTVRFSENVTTAVQTIRVSQPVVFYNATVDDNGSTGNTTLALSGSGSVTVSNVFTHEDGILNGGTWQVQGDVIVNTLANGGTAQLTFTGDKNQTYTDQGGNELDGDITINKTGGTITLASNADWNKDATQDIVFSAGNAGVLSQGQYTIAIGGNWTHTSGMFSGGSGGISMQTFTQAGGTFTSTNGTMTVGKDNAPSSGTQFYISGGVFNHNGGTVKFTGYVAGLDYGQITVDVLPETRFWNVEYVTSYLTRPQFLVTQTGETNVVENNFTLTTNGIGGNWEVRGNVSIGTSTYTRRLGNPDYVLGTIIMTGTGNKTYACTSTGNGPKLQINNPSLTVSAALGTTNLSISAFSLLAGTFNAPSGTMNIERGQTAYSETTFLVSGGVFNHNHGTVLFASHYPSSLESESIITVLPTTHFWNVVRSSSYTSGVKNITVSEESTAVVENDLTLTNEWLKGAWEVWGNVTIGVGMEGGSGTLTFAGDKDQIFTNQGGNEPDGTITINKAGGSLFLASDARWDASSQNVTITKGILDQGASYSLYVGTTTSSGIFTIGQQSIWRNNGTGDVILGGNVVNNGQVQFMGSGSCGGADTISITSTNTTQRTWTGTGTAFMSNVSVAYQGGTQIIYASDSTKGTNVGSNWVFRSDCPAYDVGISSGAVNWLGGTINIP